MANNQFSREEIILDYIRLFENDPRVRAFWLEGADGLGLQDEYSDLDLWFDTEDNALEAVLSAAVEKALSYGPADSSIEVFHPDGQILQRNLHIQGMSPFLTLDICVQRHSRAAADSSFTEGDIIDQPHVLFDKDGVVRFVPATPPDPAVLNSLWRQQEALLGQTGRVTKYIARNQFLEALDAYDKYVLLPLVTETRILFTPAHPDLGWHHFSRHMPEDIVHRFESLRIHVSCCDLTQKLVEANALRTELNKAFSSGEYHV